MSGLPPSFTWVYPPAPPAEDPTPRPPIPSLPIHPLPIYAENPGYYVPLYPPSYFFPRYPPDCGPCETSFARGGQEQARYAEQEYDEIQAKAGKTATGMNGQSAASPPSGFCPQRDAFGVGLDNRGLKYYTIPDYFICLRDLSQKTEGHTIWPCPKSSPASHQTRDIPRPN